MILLATNIYFRLRFGLCVSSINTYFRFKICFVRVLFLRKTLEIVDVCKKMISNATIKAFWIINIFLDKKNINL